MSKKEIQIDELQKLGKLEHACKNPEGKIILFKKSINKIKTSRI